MCDTHHHDHHYHSTLSPHTRTDQDHCHYEHYQHSTHGPLHRISTSHLRNCHQHANNNHPRHYNGKQSCTCNHSSHRPSRCYCSPHRPSSLINNIGTPLGHQGRSSDLSALLERAHSHRDHTPDTPTSSTQYDEDEPSVSVLHQLLDELLNHNHTSIPPHYSTRGPGDRHVPLDILLRPSNRNTASHTRIRDGITNINLNLNLNYSPPTYCPRSLLTHDLPVTLTPQHQLCRDRFACMHELGNSHGVYGCPMTLGSGHDVGMGIGIGMGVGAAHIPSPTTQWANMYASMGCVPPRYLGGGR